jgi:DNA-binding transcriptional ArsR family regulator
VLNTVTTDRLSMIFAALADRARRAILARLAGGDVTVSELAEPFPSASRANEGWNSSFTKLDKILA